MTDQPRRPAPGRSNRERAQRGEFAEIQQTMFASGKGSQNLFDVTLAPLPNMTATEINQLRAFLETHGFPYHAESLDVLQGKMGIRE